LSYQWQFNSTNLPAATNAVLTLTNLALSQAGTYQVVVTNAAGSRTSSVALLTIYPTAAASLTFGSFSAGQFEFNVTGVPDFTYAVQASTNLVDWTTLETNSSPFESIDTNALNYPLRFYRVLYLPDVDAGD
jgi:hypothetical protein